ncbi:MAG: ribonuclease HII [Candidatus Woesearchaeota archaeon]
MALICGIDEAGRGPLIGPMVISGVVLEEKDGIKLKGLGVKDSKLVLQPKRVKLEKEIMRIAKSYKVIVVPAKEIDDALESADMNLNKLEAVKTAMIINALKPSAAIVDCPSNNIEAYEAYLRIFLKDKNIKLIVEHKADLNHIESAAASILAKVRREEEISNLKKKFGDFGSGYPSDPKTKEFLKKNYNKCPEIFRKSWSTFQKVVGQKTLKDF